MLFELWFGRNLIASAVPELVFDVCSFGPVLGEDLRKAPLWWVGLRRITRLTLALPVSARVRCLLLVTVLWVLRYAGSSRWTLIIYCTVVEGLLSSRENA